MRTWWTRRKDVARDHSPVVKIQMNANSVNDMRREDPKVSNVVSLTARGITSASACSADRPTLRRKQAARREKDMVKAAREGKMEGCRDQVERGG
jgi:hypothetical protein